VIGLHALLLVLHEVLLLLKLLLLLLLLVRQLLLLLLLYLLWLLLVLQVERVKCSKGRGCRQHACMGAGLQIQAQSTAAGRPERKQFASRNCANKTPRTCGTPITPATGTIPGVGIMPIRGGRAHGIRATAGASEVSSNSAQKRETPMHRAPQPRSTSPRHSHERMCYRLYNRRTFNSPQGCIVGAAGHGMNGPPKPCDILDRGCWAPTTTDDVCVFKALLLLPPMNIPAAKVVQHARWSLPQAAKLPIEARLNQTMVS